MNFTIVLPGQCNAKCPFCFAMKNGDAKACDDYREKLHLTLDKFYIENPSDFQISISGGEPTMSPRLQFALELLAARRDRFKKVVLTCNGANLKYWATSHEELLKKAVDHINISRHSHIEAERCRRFGVKHDFLSDETLKELLPHLPETTLVAVISADKYDNEEFAMSFINYCREMKCLCAFRKDYDLEPWFTWVVASKVIDRFPFNAWRGSCPICQQLHHEVNGVKVTWKCSMKAPTDIWTDYETILKPDGIVYYDWDNKMPVAKQKTFVHPIEGKLEDTWTHRLFCLPEDK